MPTIVLNRVTTNPAIPKAPVLGFVDSFNRPNAQSLGSTADGKPWTILGAATWQIISNAAGLAATNIQTFPVVDALTPDGTYRVKVAAVSQAAGGLALRVKDRENMLQLAFRESAGNLRLRLQSIENGGQPVILGIAAAGTTLNDGDTIDVILKRGTIEVRVNGLQRIAPVSAPLYTQETQFGFYGHPNDLGIRYDSAEFIPA